MRIYYPINGIGLGHVSRSIPLANSLVERGFNIVVSVYSGTPAYEYAKANLISGRIYGIKPVFWSFTNDGGVDIAKTLISAPKSIRIPIRHISIEESIFRKEKPNFVISDMRFAPLLIAKRFGVPRLMIVSYMLLRGDYESKLLKLFLLSFSGFLTKLELDTNGVISTDLRPPNSLYLWSYPKYLLERNKILFIGPVLSDRAKRFLKANSLDSLKEELKESRGLGDRLVISVLTSGVGLNKLIILKKILDVARKMSNKSIYFIFSLSKPSKKPFIVYRGENLEVWNWFPDVLDFYLLSDMIIAQPGPAKIFEALSTNTLVIGIPPRNQVEMINLSKRLNELKIGMGLTKDWFTVKSGDIIDAIEYVNMNRDDLKHHMSAIRREMRKYDPKKLFVKIVEKYL